MPIVESIKRAGRESRYLLEYGLLRGVLALLDAASPGTAAWIGSRVGDLAYGLGRRRRQIAIDNICRAGLVSDRQAAARIARRSFQHFGIMVAESLKADALFREGVDWQRNVHLRISPEVESALRDPERGLIIACGHLGNWEIAGQALSTMKPLVGIARPMSNPRTERIIQERKPLVRFRRIPKHDGNFARFLEVLTRREALAIMIDQHGGDRGMRVDFFGRPASTHTAVALLHLVTGMPLCFGWCRRLGPMQFEIKASGPFRYARTGDKQGNIRAILEKLTAELEQAVREAPEQYMWGHRRWRS